MATCASRVGVLWMVWTVLDGGTSSYGQSNVRNRSFERQVRVGRCEARTAETSADTESLPRTGSALIDASLTFAEMIASLDERSHIPVRAENPTIAALIRAGLERSPTFRGLYVAIAERNGILHVMWNWNLSAALAGAMPHHMTRTLNGTSYLRVLLRPATNDDAVIATIAHELHHVVEMLDEGIPATSQGVFETEAAIETGDAVRRELRAMPARRSGPTPRVLTVTRDSDRRPR